MEVKVYSDYKFQLKKDKGWTELIDDPYSGEKTDESTRYWRKIVSYGIVLMQLACREFDSRRKKFFITFEEEVVKS